MKIDCVFCEVYAVAQHGFVADTGFVLCEVGGEVQEMV
jgi:hypothetical protein